jgi:phosphoribosylaminoimidazole (AIR) synthetase
MGIGFCTIVSKSRVDNLKQILKKNKVKYHQIGYITKGKGAVSMTLGERKYRLTG